MTKLLIKRIPLEGWNGDRAGKSTPYNDYKLILKQNGIETELVYIKGYDNFYCSHRNKNKVLQELEIEVEKFEKIFSVKAQGFKLVKKVTVTEEWVEE